MRRSLRLPALLLLPLLTASGLAAPVALTFGDDAQWLAQASKTPPAPTGISGTMASGRRAKVEVVGEQKLYVTDLRRNLAFVGEPKAIEKLNPLSPDKATHLITVTVLVKRASTEAPGDAGKDTPVDEAAVELKTAAGTQSAIAAGGKADFNWVPIGPATVTAKTRDATNATVTTETPIEISRDGLSTFTVRLGATAAPATGVPAATGTSAPSSPSSASAPTPPAPAPNVVGNIVSTILGLGVVAGLGYAGWRYAQRNPDAVKAGLAKIGAEPPGPLEPEDPPAPTPASTPDPVPSGPILLAPPKPISIPQSISVGSVAATGVPKLVSADGGAFEIPEGETVVGREALGGLMVAHETVSRNHARIVRSGGSVRVEDLGSTNGTFVNGAPAPATLSGGESVRFGQVEYRYEA